MSGMSDPQFNHVSVSRRQLLVTGGLVAGALAAIGPRTVVAAAAPEVDTSFKDFTLPKF